MKTIRLLLMFYNSFAFVSFLLTAVCAVIIYFYGIAVFQILFWFKVFTLGLLYYFVDSYKSHEYYYYKNLGLSRSRLWVPVLVFDFCFFIISMIIVATRFHEIHP